MGRRRVVVIDGDSQRRRRLPPWLLVALVATGPTATLLASGHTVGAAVATGVVAAALLCAVWSGAATVAVRSGWRQRRRLLPAYVAAAAFALAAASHAAGNAAATSTLGVAAAGAAIWWAHRYRSSRVRNAVAAGAGVAATWFAWVAALGLSVAAVAMWVVGTSAAVAAQCWRYRVRPRVRPRPGESTVPRDRMRMYREILAGWPAIAASAGMQGVDLEMIEDRGPVGYRLELDPGPGGLAKSIRERAEQLASALLAKATIDGASCAVEALGVRYARVDVMRLDPLAEPIPWTLQQAFATGDIRDRLIVGRYEDGEPEDIGLYDADGAVHGQAMGKSRSGKSGLANQIAAKGVTARNALCISIDRKGGQEFRAWEPAMFWHGTTADMAEAILYCLVEVVETRGETASGRVWDPDVDGPALAAIIDEAAEVLGGTDPQTRRCISKAESIRRRGASVGVELWLFTQLGTTDAYGNTQISKSAHINACFKTDKPGDIRHALANPHGLDASTFEDDQRGSHFIEARGAKRPRRARGLWMTDGDVAMVVDMFASRQGPIDEATAAAIRRGLEKFIAERRDDPLYPAEVKVYLPPSLTGVGGVVARHSDVIDGVVVVEEKNEPEVAQAGRQAPRPAAAGRGPLGPPISPLPDFPVQLTRIADQPEKPRRSWDGALAAIRQMLDEAGEKPVPARDIQAVTGYKRSRTVDQLREVLSADGRRAELVGEGPTAGWRWAVPEAVSGHGGGH